MENYDKLSFEDDTKLFSDIIQNTVKCKCSHSVLMGGREERKICTHCGKWVYKNPKIEFKYKLKEAMIKKKKEGK